MTDNEIVKAWIVVLENKRMPTEHLINVTIDRINSLTADVFRQQAEINVKNRLLDEAKAEIEKNENIIKLADKTIETANAEIEDLINGQETLQKHIATLQAENERLKEIIEYKDICIEACEEAKSEAVKECLVKVKNYIKTHCNPYGKPDFDYDTSIKILNFIDNLLKELVGENDAR